MEGVAQFVMGPEVGWMLALREPQYADGDILLIHSPEEPSQVRERGRRLSVQVRGGRKCKHCRDVLIPHRQPSFLPPGIGLHQPDDVPEMLGPGLVSDPRTAGGPVVQNWH